MSKIIKRERSIIPACDVPLADFEEIIKGTAEVDGVGAYKIGFYLMLAEGVKEIDVPHAAVYNHGSGATDIPDTGKKFISAIVYPGLEGVIYTPTAGPATQRAWINAAKDKARKVFLEPYFKSTTFFQSEGGYIRNNAVKTMLEIGKELDVEGIIVPEGTKKHFREEHNVFWTRIYERGSNGEILNFRQYEELHATDVMKAGLQKVVEVARKYTDKPIIYDHQKAGMDVPEKSHKFMTACSESGVDAVILFPQAGPEQQVIWTNEAKKKNLGVIVGGLMTHPQYRESDGGYITNEAINKIYEHAIRQNIQDFVVPGNKPGDMKKINNIFDEHKIKATSYSPGLISQKGDITEAAENATQSWHAIVGRAIYNAEDKTKAAIELTKKI